MLTKTGLKRLSSNNFLAESQRGIIVTEDVMFNQNDIVKSGPFVGIIDKVYVNKDDSEDIVYSIAWAKNAYQARQTELIPHDGRLMAATVDELEARIAQLAGKYDNQLNELRQRIENVMVS